MDVWPFCWVGALEGQRRHFRKVDVSIVNQRRCDIFVCVHPKVMHISIYIYTIYYYIDYTSSTFVTQKAHLVISLAFFHGSCDPSHVSPLTTFGRCPSSSAHSRTLVMLQSSVACRQFSSWPVGVDTWVVGCK